MKFWILVVVAVSMTSLSACGDDPQPGSGGSTESSTPNNGSSTEKPDDYDESCMGDVDDDVLMFHNSAVRDANNDQNGNIELVECLGEGGHGRYDCDEWESQETLHQACWEHGRDDPYNEHPDPINDEPCLWTAYGYIAQDGYCYYRAICVRESDWSAFYVEHDISNVEPEWDDEIDRVCDFD